MDGDTNEFSDKPDTSATGTGESPAAASKPVDLEPDITELQMDLRNTLAEDPERTIQRLEREIKCAVEDAPAAGLTDPSRRPKEADPEKGTTEARKSQDIATAWASSKKVSGEQAAKVLEGVRERAGSWGTGTASVLAVITATLVLGGDTFDSIRASTRVVPAVPYAIALSVLLALVSLYLTLRAANGPAFLDTKIRETVGEAPGRDLRRAGAAAANLKAAQVLLTIAVLIFLAALVAMWAAPSG